MISPNNFKAAILVSSCDAYEDVWNPFFALFKKYWPNCKYNIYLNTESKMFSYDGLNITCLHPGESEKQISWSNRLKQALLQVEEDVVICFLEDFFLLSEVNNDAIEECLDWMAEDKKLGCIRIKNHTKYTDQITHGEFAPPPDNYDYAVSTQAAIWNKNFLLELLRDESAWEFEYYGSGRFNRIYRKEGYRVYNHIDEAKPIVDYKHWPEEDYGIIQGKWCQGTIALFAREGIQFDFDSRGFAGESEATNVNLSKRTVKEKILSVVTNPYVVWKRIRYSDFGNKVYRNYWIKFRRRYLNH